MNQKYLFILVWTLAIPSLFIEVVQTLFPVWIWKPYLIVTGILALFLALSYFNGYLKFENSRLNSLTFWIKNQRRFDAEI